MDMMKYGAGHTMTDVSKGALLGRITAVHKERFELVCANGECFGRLKKGSYYAGTEAFPTVGDFVELFYNPQGDCRIVRTLERKTYFSREDPSSAGHWEQAVAANFDYVFILQSLNEDFNVRRVERYLTLAWHSGAKPVVVLTKADLNDHSEDECKMAESVSQGVPVIPVSAKTGQGLELLHPYMQPAKTAVLLGSSGVGKSSLLNALTGEQTMQTGEIREADGRGRHTTTHRQLIMTKTGTMFIDTPGMRELGMWDVSGGLGQTFSDVESFFGQCRFRDCSHQSEPACAVKSALKSGALSEERWRSYCKLKRETKFSEGRTAGINNRKTSDRTGRSRK